MRNCFSCFLHCIRYFHPARPTTNMVPNSFSNTVPKAVEFVIFKVTSTLLFICCGHLNLAWYGLALVFLRSFVVVSLGGCPTIGRADLVHTEGASESIFLEKFSPIPVTQAKQEQNSSDFLIKWDFSPLHLAHGIQQPIPKLWILILFQQSFVWFHDSIVCFDLSVLAHKQKSYDIIFWALILYLLLC